MPFPARPQDAPPPRGGGAVGKITDREGTAGRRGAAEPRWTSADARTPVEPGDWIKTGSRGANALAVELGGGSLLLGPGALIEVLDAGRVRLHAGEVEVTPKANGKLVVDGPASREVTARTVFRASTNAPPEALAEDPRWLTGYRQNASTEAVGALLATVDGRDVPLTLGYHKVNVDIRDQLARTEIEESFVNHTSSVLEGVFYFPLPADASISGFSMWIGDQQVHGEIVEKQRARAIYETILREKRDPGLLEWSGGNLFKARVYPIGAEKRIKITYTQVLPQTVRQDGKGELVYSHALASEHLRLHPLAKLALSVTVSSQRPIVDVSSPTHTCRIQKTERAARVEHEDEEVSPDRDFEVRIGVTRPASGLTLASHRRGDDGYFMVVVDAPPAPADARPPEKLDLLVLADTSGSLAGAARDAQLRVITALLEGLGPKDTFNLATCDVDVKWAFERPEVATPAARETALGHLEGRRPLGWTDLDRAISAAAERCGPTTHVVYVGDGAVTTGDADPQGFARRAPSLFKGQGTFHAVVPSSTAETAALRAIAALGGGSVRTLGGADAQDVVFALLKEIATPGVKDLSLKFEGLEVAAVYPEVLPSMPAGTQQVVVGRWNAATAPADGVRGRVTIRGTVGGAPVTATHDVALGAGVPTGAPEAPDDASFIPRLWARAHLEQLLSQGSSKELQAKIVALSEDFQIITPYTSFLVLETDADRARFQVKKRFRMRDGEEFFAKGRDDAQHELARQAALAARRWRRELRARTLEALAGLNRDLTWDLSQGGGRGDEWRNIQVGYSLNGAAHLRRTADYELSSGGAGAVREDVLLSAPATTTAGPADELEEAKASDGDFDKDDAMAGEEAQNEVDAPAEPQPEAVMKQQVANSPVPMQPMAERSRRELASFDDARGYAGRAQTTGDRFFATNHAGVISYRGLVDGTRSSLFDGLVAGLPPAPGEPPARVWPAGWPKDVQDAIAPIDLFGRVASAQGGLRIRSAVERKDARERPRAAGEALWLLAADRWATASLHRDGEDVRIDWLEKDQRGAVTAMWNLGRVRPAGPGDARAWGAPWDYSQAFEALGGLHEHTATARRLDGGQVELTFTHKDTAQRFVLVVEPAKGVVRSARWSNGDTLQGAVAFEVAEVAGAGWYPTRMTRTDAAGKTIETTTFTVELLAPAPFDAALAEVLAVRAQSALLKPLPKARAARVTAREKKGTLEDHWVVLGQLSAAQRWDAARPHLDAVLAAMPTRPATAVRATALLHSRRHEELRVELHRLVAELVATPRPAEASAALHVLGWGGVLSDGSERHALVTQLSTVVARHPALEDARWGVDMQEVQALQMLNRPDEALARLRALVARHPERVDGHQQLAYWLQNLGDPEAAVAHLDDAIAKHGPWPTHERNSLAQVAVSVLWNTQRLEALVARAERVERDDPEASAQLAAMHLGALVMLDRADAAWQKAVAWIAPALGPDATKLDDLARTRLVTAVQHAMGQGPGIYSDRIEDDRAAHLALVVKALARTPELADVTRQITQDWRWNQHVVGRATMTTLLAELRKEAATLPPAAAVAFFYTVRNSGPVAGAAPAAVWDEILDAFEARMKAIAKTDAPGARLLRDAVFAYGGAARQLRLLREEYVEAQASGDARDAAHALAGAVLGQPWTKELEQEATSLLAEVGPRATDKAPVADARRDAQTHLLLSLLDWATQQRAAAAVAARPDHGELDRRRLATANDEALRDARVAALELVALLEPLLPAQSEWLLLERTWLQVKLGRDREAVRAACLALLDARLGAAESEKKARPRRDQVVAARAMATLLYLVGTDEGTAQATSAEALAQRLERGLASPNDTLLDWRQAKLALLLLRDQPAELEATLRAWFGEADVDALRWGLPLTYVLAERDDLTEAAAVLERLAEQDEVGHADLQRLASFYTALDQKEAARAAKARAWALLDEWSISSSLQQDAARVSRTGDGVPEELDPETAVKLSVLLRKAEYPENHLWTVRQLYETTRDFRLLEGLAEGVLGHSAQKVYRLLEGLRNVTSSLQEEATLDRLSAALTALHGRAGTTPVDRRALRLLELIVERQAAEQTQGAGPHRELALKAMREAFASAEARDGAWAPGEPVLYAALLAHQGAMPDALGVEQLRQLQALLRLQSTPDDHLALSLHLATTLWAHGKQDDALRTLWGALELVRGKDGLLAPRHHDALDVLTSYLMSVGRYRDAEGLYEGELAPPQSPARHGVAAARRLRLSLHRLWTAALGADAEVRLGKRRALYEAARDALRADLGARTDESHAMQLIQALCSLWGTARQRVGPVGDDVSRFAFGELPAVLAQYQHRNASYMISMLVDALVEHKNHATALELIVARAEAEPRWLRLQNGHLWAQQGWRFGQLRAEAGQAVSATLSERLLEMVKRELAADLRAHRGGGQSICAHVNNSHFWREQAEAFAQVARDVLASRRDSEATLVHVATYLHDGLSRKDEAIAVLVDADQRGVLAWNARHLLCAWLQDVARWAESLVIAERLVAEQPAQLDARCMVIRALFHTKQGERLGRALADAEAYLRETKAWGEAPAATLGALCVEVSRPLDAVRFLDEAIMHHTRSRPDRGVGGGTLSHYYQQLAQAHLGLGDTDKAVDAACGAVVAWGRHEEQRGQALEVLVTVLVAAKDLDAYLQRVDREAAETKLENPTLRKALGNAYRRRGDPKKAEVQLRLSLEAQPNDVAVHRGLIEMLDVLNRPAEAAEQVLALAAISGHEASLYSELGDRWSRLGQPELAERAWTNLVEMLPHEAESHQALAQVRESQGRLADAIEQWRQVVRVRTDEPPGWLSLARALLKTNEKKEAAEIARKLIGTEWDDRFGDVHAQAQSVLNAARR